MPGSIQRPTQVGENMLNNNLLALVITFASALVWLRINDFAAHKGWVSSQVSRKIIHTGTGPIFVICWLLFTDDPNSRYLAALVPLSITLQFILVGLGAIQDDAAVKAMSRSGNPREILKGPVFYGIIFVFATLYYWLDTPTGIIALMLMCGGDGLADIAGRRWGKIKLPWSKQKSWAGSLAMLAGGWLFSTLLVFLFISAGIFPGNLGDYILPISVIALAGAIIESLPFEDIDNFSVTFTAVLLGTFLF